MYIIGLTGGIASGKSTVAGMFRCARIPVISADALVHELQDRGGAAVEKIGAAFPDSVKDGAIDRRALAKHTLSNKEKLKVLENIMHPLVREARRRQLSILAAQRVPAVVLEIPLLFETGADALCDIVVTTSAPEHVRKRRAMQRPHMTEEKFQSILKHQMNDHEKRKRAGHIIHTGRGRHQTFQEVQQVLQTISTMPATRWHPGYGR